MRANSFPLTGGRLGWGSCLAICLLFLTLFATACQQQLPNSNTQADPLQVSLSVDGDSFNLTSEAATVRELINEADIELGDLDEVSPPLFTPLQEGMEISIVRVTESLEVTTESIPFERKFVRTDNMSADDEPQLVQAGKNGLREVTVRIVYQDGIETQRWRASEVIVEEPQDELVMIGIGTSRGNTDFPGLLAYISGGTAVLMRSSTAFPQQMNIDGQLDGRVFELSPDGTHLLYTQTTTDTTTFNNSLWMIPTNPNAEPISLDTENVLWAGWNPAVTVTDTLQIAYTTARPSSQPPGWEANNDLWLGNIDPTAEEPELEVEQIGDVYPALNGWWGGNYAWSPDGRLIAYAYANEVGVLDTFAEEEAFLRRQIAEFAPFNTNADWVWVPTLTWSPDGRFLAFTQHDGEDEEEMIFNSWVYDTFSPLASQFVEETGMWGHLQWASSTDDIAFLKAADPLDSLRSNYTLWLMDSDGSNPRQIYPPVGENSAFSRDENFMAWSPDGRSMAFIFDNDLFLLDLDSGEATRITQDDTVDSHPVWSVAPAVPASPTIRTTPTPTAAVTVTPNSNGRITTTPTSGNE